MVPSKFAYHQPSTVKEAIALLASTEGILLDPVYTGRAMGGLINLIRVNH